jgi:hypothetical protein
MERLVPGDPFETVLCLPQRISEPIVRSDDLRDSGRLDAAAAPVHRVLGVACHGNRPRCIPSNDDAAVRVAKLADGAVKPVFHEVSLRDYSERLLNVAIGQKVIARSREVLLQAATNRVQTFLNGTKAS